LKAPLPRAPKPPKGEFKSARWVSFDRAVSGAAPFRKPVYQKLREHLKTLDKAPRKRRAPAA
jgi:hypothetical protein